MNEDFMTGGFCGHCSFDERMCKFDIQPALLGTVRQKSTHGSDFWPMVDCPNVYKYAIDVPGILSTSTT